MISELLTKNQQEIWDTYVSNNRNLLTTSKILNKKYSTVRSTFRHIREKLKELGKDPKDIDKIPDTTYCSTVKSTSTLYDKNGNMIHQWVKSDVSKNQLKNLAKKFAAEYSNKLPKYKPTKCNSKDKYYKNLAVYPIADVHMGMLSWIEETGKNYNTKEADKITRCVISRLMDRTPPCEECLILNLGDFLHVDNQVHQTERSGNVLDVDGRYAKILNIAIKLMRYIIEYGLQRHKKVTVINCTGNHDDLGSLWLSAALQNIYEKETRLTIINEPKFRHYYTYGNTLIGCTHGNDIKLKDLPLIMATEMPEKWGKSKYRYFYTGHFHHDIISEYGDCKVETFRAICPQDAFSVSKGYMAGRDMKCIIIDPEKGEIERYTLNI